MEHSNRRSSTRIRKPTAKLIESQSKRRPASLLQQKCTVNKVDAEAKSIQTTAGNQDRLDGASSKDQDIARVKQNIHCRKDLKTIVKRRSLKSFPAISNSSNCKSDDDDDDTADVELVDKIIKIEAFNSEEHIDLSQEDKSKIEVNFEQEINAESKAKEMLSKRNKSDVQETYVDNNSENDMKPGNKLMDQKNIPEDHHRDVVTPENNCNENEGDLQSYPKDVSKPVKKRTVQVCVRLQDMKLIPEIKKDYIGLEEAALKGKNLKNGHFNVKKKRKYHEQDGSKQIHDHSNDLSFNGAKDTDSSKQGQNGAHNCLVIKEDGSFVEANDKFHRSAEINFTNIKMIKLEDLNSEMKIYHKGDAKDGKMMQDADLQADIALEDLDAADGDLSDFDEGEIEDSLQCKICSKVLSSKCNLSKHMALHSDAKPFQCEICGMSFALKAYLKVHSVVHSGNRKHKCEICNKTFLRRTNLTAHLRSHSDIKAFSCDTCGKKFKTKLGRDAHLKEHGPEPGFQCHKCGKSYSQKAYLLKHISIHAGVKPFKCEICGKTFPYNQSLLEHMRRHKGEKPETCDVCGRSFNNKRELRKHMQYHNTVSQFACKECNMFYDSQQSLNKHLSKTHNRKHCCEYCSQSFVNKKHLKTHQACEHKEHIASARKMPTANLAKAKKVACSLCSRVFYNRYVLSKHLMSKHMLSEQDMKDLLNIRKKAVSKKQMDRYLTSDVIEDFDKVLENDKSFRVYYKDEEMSVYVKGTHDFDSRLKDTDGSSHTLVNDSVNNQEVRYIVLEDNEIETKNEYIEIGHSNDVEEPAHLKDKVNLVESMCSGTVSKMEVSEAGTSETKNGNAGDQNYYVVFTEANENSEKVVEEIDSKIVSEAEVQNFRDNEGTERIVLILNEGEDGKNFMLGNGEHYEIVADAGDVLFEDHNAQIDEYKTVSEELLKVTNDLQGDVVKVKGGNVKGTDNNAKAATSCTHTEDNSHNLPLLEQLQSHDIVNDTRSSFESTGERTTKKVFSNEFVPHVVIEELNVQSEANIQNEQNVQNKIPHHYDRLPESISENIEEVNYDMISEIDNLKAQYTVSENTKQVATCSKVDTADLEELLPKSNSAHEFASFENALKLKSGDFQNQEEYNIFLDKMILTLQKAKHTDQN